MDPRTLKNAQYLARHAKTEKEREAARRNADRVLEAAVLLMAAVASEKK